MSANGYDPTDGEWVCIPMPHESVIAYIDFNTMLIGVAPQCGQTAKQYVPLSRLSYRDGENHYPEIGDIVEVSRQEDY